MKKKKYFITQIKNKLYNIIKIYIVKYILIDN